MRLFQLLAIALLFIQCSLNIPDEDDIILDLVNGKFSPQGKLPFDLPETMEAEEQKLEDVPFDTPHLLFSFGDGLTY